MKTSLNSLVYRLFPISSKMIEHTVPYNTMIANPLSSQYQFAVSNNCKMAPSSLQQGAQSNKNKKTGTDELFQQTFLSIMEDIFKREHQNAQEMEFKGDMEETWRRLKAVMLYTVPHGKQLRGQLVVVAFKELVRSPSEEMMELARVLGWCVEILQASFLVADDIMDNGYFRRGQPCWHRVNNQGVSALSDVYLLEHVAYQIIHKYFKTLPCYTDLLDLCLDITFKTIRGQSLDTRSSMCTGSHQQRNFEAYNVTLYNSIVTCKTSYYTCYLPVALAMSLAGIPKKSISGELGSPARLLWESVERVTLEIGHLFQVQDDYLDCFGDEQKMGKLGLDIQEGKCTWLFVTAKEICKKNELHTEYQLLKDNYGSEATERVVKVKQLYKELNLPHKFQRYQEQVCRKIVDCIRDLHHSALENVLTKFFDLIYKRTY